MLHVICPKCGEKESVVEEFNDGLYYEYLCESCGVEWSQKWNEEEA